MTEIKKIILPDEALNLLSGDDINRIFFNFMEDHSQKNPTSVGFAVAAYCCPDIGYLYGIEVVDGTTGASDEFRSRNDALVHKLQTAEESGLSKNARIEIINQIIELFYQNWAMDEDTYIVEAQILKQISSVVDGFVLMLLAEVEQKNREIGCNSEKKTMDENDGVSISDNWSLEQSSSMTPFFARSIPKHIATPDSYSETNQANKM